jgi:hypothetical protein
VGACREAWAAGPGADAELDADGDVDEDAAAAADVAAGAGGLGDTVVDAFFYGNGLLPTRASP